MAHYIRDEACEVFLKQEIDSGLKEGKRPATIGKELARWLKERFEANIPARSVEQRARRRFKSATNVAQDKGSGNNDLDGLDSDYQEPEETQTQNKPPEQEPPKPYISVFNETNENIDWARFSWNPVTGCLHNCKYCYARDIANRFFKEKFKPTFHPNRLSAPKNTALPENNNGRDRNVFVCSMSDLFGSWVKQAWIDRTLDAVKNSPEWNFIFLTKNPERMIDIEWPQNTKVGTTVDVQARVELAEKSFFKIKAPVKFLSCEPLLEDIQFNDLSIFDCVIIGAQSRSTQCPEFQPPRKWVTNLILQAEDARVKRIFLKPNLNVYRQFP